MVSWALLALIALLLTRCSLTTIDDSQMNMQFQLAVSDDRLLILDINELRPSGAKPVGAMNVVAETHCWPERAKILAKMRILWPIEEHRLWFQFSSAAQPGLVTARSVSDAGRILGTPEIEWSRVALDAELDEHASEGNAHWTVLRWRKVLALFAAITAVWCVASIAWRFACFLKLGRSVRRLEAGKCRRCEYPIVVGGSSNSQSACSECGLSDTDPFDLNEHRPAREKRAGAAASTHSGTHDAV